MSASRFSWRRTPMALRLVIEVGVLLGSLALFVMQPVWRELPAPAVTADASRLRHDVQVMAVDFHPRNYRSAGLEQTARFIEAEFRAAGARTEVQPYEARGHQVRNVIAHFGPATGAPVVIGAHYDSHFETPGADDNASGCAGLLELARMLSKRPPSVPVQLVAYTLEEPPFYASRFMGSHVHARSLRDAGRPVRAMVALEMIGFYQSGSRTQDYPIPGLGLLYPDKGDFIGVVGRPADWLLTRDIKAALKGSFGSRVYSMNAPAGVQGVDYSDHRSYWRAGYTAVMVTDTAFLRNKEYHEAGDTAQRLDYGRMARVVNGVAAYVLSLKP